MAWTATGSASSRVARLNLRLLGRGQEDICAENRIIMGKLITGKMGDLGSTQAKVQHICPSQWADSLLPPMQPSALGLKVMHGQRWLTAH